MLQRVFAGLVALFLTAAYSPVAHAEGNDLTGQRAPDLYVPQALQGVTPGTTLASYAGKVLVLKFWFAGCPHCRASLPDFQRLADQYAGRPEVQFLALAYDTYDSAASLVRGAGYRFPVAVDPTGVTPGRYGVRTYPTDYIIGGDGIVKAYDTLSTWAIDRAAATAAPVVPPETLRERNLRELGDVPAALADAKDAAATNDYGRVLRVVEAHLDAAKDPADVVAAALRIQKVAYEHYMARARRLIERWRLDPASARQPLDAFAADFQGTSKAKSASDFVAQFAPSSAAPR